MIAPKVIYSPQYDIRFFGIEKLHPFDSCKYSRAWGVIKEQFGSLADSCLVTPPGPASKEDLLLVHTREYIDSLNTSANIATALEMAILATMPPIALHQFLLKSMLFATNGTIIAAREAMRGKIAVNLGGGYHHASSEKGEGFCLYSDVSIAIAKLRQEELLKKGSDRILYVDLDAHLGNGFARNARGDNDIFIADAFNAGIYPNDPVAKARVDYPMPLYSRIGDEEYLATVRESINAFSEMLTREKFAIAFYNAGTDVMAEDKLGGMSLSHEGVFQRDKMVLDAIIQAGIPCVMVLSGGYSENSYKAIARTVSYILETWGANSPA